MIHNHGLGWLSSKPDWLAFYLSAQWDAEDGDEVALGHLYGKLHAAVGNLTDFEVEWIVGPTTYVREVRGKEQRHAQVIVRVFAGATFAGGKMHRERARAAWRRAVQHDWDRERRENRG